MIIKFTEIDCRVKDSKRESDIVPRKGDAIIVDGRYGTVEKVVFDYDSDTVAIHWKVI